MKLINFMFIFSILSISFILHFLLYLSIKIFFKTFFLKFKPYLIIILFFLFISFLLSSIFVHNFPNIFFRIYYAISSLWYGLLFFLLLASVFLWLVKLVEIIFPALVTDKTFLILGCLLYGGAFLLTTFSAINALNIKINNLTIPIKNLPPFWENKKIVHLTDLHIGTLHGESFLKKIVKIVNSHDPDVIAFTGDIFDGASGNHQKYQYLFEQFQYNLGAFFITGNHEIYSGANFIKQIISKSGIKILDNEIVELEDLYFIGVPFPGSDYAEGTLLATNINAIKNIQSPKVLLTHSPEYIEKKIKRTEYSGLNSYFGPDIQFDLAISQGISLQLAGHTHGGQFFPFTIIVNKIYKGFHYGLHKIGDFHVYISSGAGTWGPPLRLGSSSEIAVINLTKALPND